MLLVLTIVLLAAANSLATRTWSVGDSGMLLQVLPQAQAGDVIELEPGDYVFTTPQSAAQLAPILLDKPLTLRSRNKRQRATLINNGASLLVAITSPLVTLADIVIAPQLVGGDERSIDVLIGAGTQTFPANAAQIYGEVEEGAPALAIGERKRSANSGLAPDSKAEILLARELQRSPRAKETLRKRSADVLEEGAMRALDEIRIDGVDFSGSRSRTNVAFARGSYSSIVIRNSVFGRKQAAHINAIVAVGDAQFLALAVRSNSFYGGANVLFGSPTVDAASFGLNFWGSTGPQVFIGGTDAVPETYCIDVDCERLAPVVDGDAPERVFATLQAAFAAGVRKVVVTDDLTLTQPAVITAPTELLGARSTSGAPRITVSTGGAIVSQNGALQRVGNVRMRLAGVGSTGFVFTDGSAQRLQVGRAAQSLLTLVEKADGVLGVTLFDGVSITGDQSADQIGVLVSAPKARVELEDVVMVQVHHGAIVHRGSLVSADSSFFSAGGAAIYAETVTHQAGLRVSGSTFIGSGAAIELGSGASSNTLHEFYVQCSQFLFNKRRNPIVAHDCAKKPTLCAAALRYNTIISDFPLADESKEGGASDTRMFKQGLNHVEHGRNRIEYAYFGSAKSQFSLSDTHGRLSWVSGALSVDEASSAEFLLATYAPLRAECFEVDGVSPEASVVSDVLEVRSDSMLHGSASMAARFRIDDRASLPATLGVFGVSHLGERSVWVRATSVTHAAGNDNQATIESTIAVHNVEDDKHTHRLVVVALETLPEKLQAAINFGSAITNDSPRTIAKRLCVVCDSNSNLPAHFLDEYCGGSTDNMRTSFDEAYTELGFGASTGAPRATGASIYVYGTCKTPRCSFGIDHNEHIEGTSPTVRGTLVSTCKKPSKDTAFIFFNGRASAHSSLRFMTITTDALVAVSVDAPQVVENPNGSPMIAYCTIGGVLGIDARSGGRYINNDLGRPGVGAALVVANSVGAPMTETPVIIEANHFASGGILVSLAGALADIRIDRNVFSANGAIAIHTDSVNAAVHITANEGLVAIENHAGNVTAIGNSFAKGAALTLMRHDSFIAGKTKLAGAQLFLSDSVRLTNTQLDNESHVHVKGDGAVVLRGVHFDSIGTSLRSAHKVQSCANFELSPLGIDLARSLIYAGEQQTLTADQQKRMVEVPSAYWALDGSVAECADGQPIVRTEEYCGCADRSSEAAIEVVDDHSEDTDFDQVFSAQAVVPKKNASGRKAGTLDTTSTSSNTVLIVLLIVVGVIVLVCLAIGACVILGGSRAVNTVQAASRATGGASRVAAAPPVADTVETSVHADHNPYVVRKRKPKMHQK